MKLDLPNLRSDLDITPRISEGEELRYILAKPEAADLFEFGEKEYFICRQLDGANTPQDIQEAFRKRFGLILPLEQLSAFVRHLESLGLLADSAPAPAEYGYPVLRLGNPDRLFQVLASMLRGCFSPLFLVAAMLVMGVAAGVAIRYGSAILSEMALFWAPIPFFAKTLMGLLLINVAAEVGKAVACKHYGGYVLEAGVMFVYRVIPLFYCSVSDAFWWKERSKWLRMFAAGLACQLLLLSLGLIGWKVTAYGTGVHTFWFVMIVSGFIFFFLNLIPLFPRDGYHFLSIWLETPDMWNRSRCFVKAWFWRRTLPEPLTSGEKSQFKWFGLFSLVWEFGFWTLVLGFLGYLLVWRWNLKGVGASCFLALLLLVSGHFLKRRMLELPFLKGMVRDEGGKIKLRLAFKLGALILLLLLALFPYQLEVGGEFSLSPANQLAIRATVPGEVTSILVQENQWVEQGQPVARLLEKDYQTRVLQAEAVLSAAREKLAMLHKGPTPEEIAKAEQEVSLAAKSLEYSELEAKRSAQEFKDKAISEKDYQNALKVRDLDKERLVLAQKDLEVVKAWPRIEEINSQEAEVLRLEAELKLAEKNLMLSTLTSPMAGLIITQYPAERVGQYLNAGDVVVMMEDSRHCKVDIEVPEEDIGAVEVGADVRLRTWAHPMETFTGKVVAVAPVAYEKSRHRVERLLSEKEYLLTQKEIMRDEGRVVRVVSEFPNEEGLLKTGMTGYAKIEAGRMPAGLAFFRWLVRFVRVEIWSWIP